MFDLLQQYPHLIVLHGIKLVLFRDKQLLLTVVFLALVLFKSAMGVNLVRIFTIRQKTMVHTFSNFDSATKLGLERSIWVHLGVKFVFKRY